MGDLQNDPTYVNLNTQPGNMFAGNPYNNVYDQNAHRFFSF